VLERRLDRITAINIDEGTIQLTCQSSALYPFSFSFIHPSFHLGIIVLKSKRVRSVREECRRVRSSTEEYASGRKSVVSYVVVRHMTAYLKIRTRTLASDSIEKSENDATKANDESFPYSYWHIIEDGSDFKFD
jgi:hypothetical protein